MKPAALLVIDIQNDFTQPSGRLPVPEMQAEQIIANINAMIVQADRLELQPVYIGNEFGRFDPLNLFRNFRALKGSAGAKLDPRLKFVNRHYFAKRTDNALTNPALVSFLRECAVDRLYLTGLYAEACVFRTFQGAQKSGWGCRVVTDAVASKSDRKRLSMVDRYAALGAELVTTSQVLNRT